MHKALILSLIISLLIHILLITPLLQRTVIQKRNLENTFEVLLSADTNSASENTSGKQKKQLKKRARKFSLNDLSPKAYTPPTDGPYDESRDSYGDSIKDQEGDSLETMNSLTLPQISENIHFFEAIKNKIDQNIQYPQELTEHNIQGKTNLTILINHKGELLEVYNVSALNPYVTTYSLIGIHQALKEPLPQYLWFKPERTLTLSLHFDFKIYTMGNMQERNESSYYKNRFDFLRVRNAKNFLEEFVELNARYIPPIVPLPGGFYVDFIQAYRMIVAWQELDPRMRKRQRLLMTKEKLDAQLKAIKNTKTN